MTPRAARASTAVRATPRIPRLGERVRQLRVAAGLTQTDLAGDRFSKEYISQIERGKTRPTTETVEWLAMRLGVDAGFLASGVSADERAKAEAILARADALSQEHRFAEAVEEYTRALAPVDVNASVHYHRRALSGDASQNAQSAD
jgi:transcriptional regulator with XRE-family HTH domain